MKPTRLVLISVVVALALLGGVAGLVWPAFFVRERPDPDRICRDHLRVLADVLMVHAKMWDGRLPPPDLLGYDDRWTRVVVRDYPPAAGMLYCPLDKTRCGATSYRIPAAAYGLDLRHLPHPEQVVVLTEKCEFHDHGTKRWAFFADRHLRLLPSRK